LAPPAPCAGPFFAPVSFTVPLSMATYAVIMAGGVGSRFWPRSRQAEPKQFLRVLSPESLLQNTFARLQPLIPAERVLVVTHAATPSRRGTTSPPSRSPTSSRSR
jgi:2-C-methyl-D-erythritol 4-phosphate cytidylyltransferase